MIYLDGFEQFDVCKERLLRMLADYLPRLGKRLAACSVQVKDVCMLLFAKDKTARVKAACFAPLMAVRTLQLALYLSLFPQTYASIFRSVLTWRSLWLQIFSQPQLRADSIVCSKLAKDLKVKGFIERLGIHDIGERKAK